MPRTHKIILKQNLYKYRVYVEDTAQDSEYFQLSEVPDVLSGGKSAFLINGSDFLKATTNVLVEILDVEGNPIFNFPIRDYAEGLARLISVEVYETTPKGYAFMTILGELTHTSDGRPVPDEWKGKYNVKYTHRFLVDPALPNTNIVRLYKRPTYTARELLATYREVVPPSGSVVIESASFLQGRITAIPTPVRPPTSPTFGTTYYTPPLEPSIPLEEPLLDEDVTTVEPYIYIDPYSVGTHAVSSPLPLFNSSMVGGTLEASIRGIDPTGTTLSSTVRPVADTSNGDAGYTGVEWYDQTDSLPATWYILVNDQSDTTYWRTRSTGATGQWAVKLDSPSFTTANATGHKIGIRADVNGTVLYLNFVLYQGDPAAGGTVIYTAEDVTSDIKGLFTTTPTDVEFTFNYDFSNINDLYLECIAVTAGTPSDYVRVYEMWGTWSGVTYSYLNTTYTSRIQSVLNNTTIYLENKNWFYPSSTTEGIALNPERILNWSTREWKITYTSGSTYLPTLLERSFVELNLRNLRTFSGDVERAKIYKKSLDNIGTEQLIADIILQGEDLTLTQSAATNAPPEVRIGYFGGPERDGFLGESILADVYWTADVITSSSYRGS